MNSYTVGDVVVSKLHAGDRKQGRLMEVISVSTTGRVVVRGQGGRRMTFQPYQLCLLKTNGGK